MTNNFFIKTVFPLFLGVLLFICLLPLRLDAQNKIKINFKQTPLKEVLREVSKQTGYSFVYSDAFVQSDKKISVKIESNNMSIKGIIEQVLKGLEVSFVIDKKQVIIAPAPVSNENKKNQNLLLINGVVRDESGEQLPGVSVKNLNSGKVVFSDNSGGYSFEVMEGDRILFESIGMKPQEITIKNNKTEYNIILKIDNVLLGDVVVTGYQTLSKERATGAFGVVSKQQLQKPTTNIASRIVGTTAGVQATLDANGDATFEIRGQSSLYANAQPLVVVDGFAIEGDFSSINPNDVESVTILKDAAASSIWGARSANGVIVVTTKNARNIKKGKVLVEISSFVKFSPKPDLNYLIASASSEDVVTYDKLSWGKWGGGKMTDRELSLMGTMTPGKVALNEKNLGYLSESQLETILSNYAKQNNQQQLKDYIFAIPFTQQYNVNIASSSEKSSNNLSLMYEPRQKFMIGDREEKYIVSYRNYSKIFNWLEINFTGLFSYKESFNNSVGLNEIKNIAPYDMLLDENGERKGVYKNIYMPNYKRYWPAESFPYPDLTYNPITEQEGTNRRQRVLQSRFQGGATFKIIEGLSLNTQLQYEMLSSNGRNIFTDETYLTRVTVDSYTHWKRSNNTFTLNIPKGSILDQNRSEITTLTFRNQLDFNKSIGKHSINAVAGFETSRKISQTFDYPRIYGYDDDRLSVGTLPNGYGSYTNPNLAIYSWYDYKTTIYEKVNSAFTHLTDKYVSMFFNTSYTYNGKYSLSASARTDASNLITDDPKYRYAPFWSVGASWQMNKEQFMSKVGWVDRLIVRMTYGYNGNVDRSTSFAPLVNMYPSNNIYTDDPYASISSYGNPSLRWERTGNFDLGVDYSLFKGKIFGKVDVYNKTSKDLIASVSIPQINGTGSQKMNVGSMINRGVEFEIGTSLPILNDDISLYGNLNFAYNYNEVTKLYRAKFTHTDLLPWNGGLGAPATVYIEGKNSKTIFGSKYAGLHNDGSESNPNWQPKIVGKDGTLYGFAGWPADDVWNYAYEQGTTVAPWVGGLSFGIKLYNFDISCIMTGKFGHVFRRTSYNYNSMIPNSRFNEVLNGDPDQILPLPKNDNESRYYFWNRFWENLTYLTQSANHVRFQELNITYNLPKRLLNKVGVSNIQIYGQGNNLFTIYANKYNEDPEFPLGTYKPSANYTFGIKVGF